MSVDPLNSGDRMLVAVYKSVRKDEMYLYVPKKSQLEDLPEALMKQFGSPEHVMDLLLTPTKKLARAEAEAVLSDIKSRGFYLQMPPSKEMDPFNL